MALTRPRAAQIYDIDYKQATRVVTVANITLTGGAPSQVDGVNLSLNDRILVTGQSTLSQNGIYYVTTLGSGSNGTWSRSLDTNNTGEILTGTIVMVTEGTIYADTQWKLITDGVINVGVTDQVWTQNYSANSISSGNSNVVVNSNANVTVSSAGTANVLVVSSTGAVVTGTLSATGNATAGNLLTGGIVSATGNATAGNVLTGGLISATGNISVLAGTFRNGDGQTNYTTPQITFGYNNTADYPQWIHTRHSAGVTYNNAIDFYTNDGTQNAAFTANAILGLTINQGRVGIANPEPSYALDVTGTANITGNILTAGQVSATGNITGNYFLGNVFYANGITASKIYSGNSEVNVTASGGNVNVSIAGTSNVAVFSTTGEYVTGVVSATGNITGSNLVTSGLISATGNLTSGNVNTAIVSATGQIVTTSAGNLDTGAGQIYLNGASENRIDWNTNGTGAPTFTTRSAGTKLDLYPTLSGSSTDYALGVEAGALWLGIPGNDGGQYIKFYGGTTEVANISGTGVMSVSGNVTGANISTGGVVSATGNATAGNILTAGIVSATGNVTGDYILGNVFYANGITASKIYSGNSEVNVTSSGGNVNVSIGGTSNVVVWSTTGEYVTGLLSVTANVTAGNITTGGIVSATGNVSGNNFVGNVVATTVNATANIAGGNISTGGIVSATGNITAGNILSDGLISVTGTINSGNIYTAGGISLTGNTITSSGATLTIDPNGSGAVDGAVVIAGNLSVQGNVTYIDSNVITTNEKSITLANNVSTGSLADGAGIDVGNNTLAYWRFNNATTSWQSNIGITPATNATLNLGGTSNYWSNIYAANTIISGTETVTGNITGGNVLTGGIVSATGNVTGNYLKGNASQVTGISTFSTVAVSGQDPVIANSIATTLNLAAGNNIVITTSNTSNTVTIAYTSGGGGSSIFATGGDMGLISQSVTASEDLGSVVDSATLSYDLGTLFSVTTANQLDVTGFTGNVNAANVNLTGLISAAGNITSNYFIGNGSQLTGVSASAAFPLANGTSNVNATVNGNITINVGGSGNVAVFATTGEYVTGVVSASGNVTGGNVLTAGLISATGNATAGNVLTGGIVSATGNATVGNISATNHTGTTVSVTGNVAGGNILTIGAISATGNLTLANITPASSNLTIVGNVFPSANATYDLGSSTARWKTIYTTDLELNNGIGDYTVVEGADDLFLYNNRSGKVFKFALIEVDPTTAPPKAKR